MLRPSVCFVAAFSFLALVPYDREASAQRKRPVATPPIVQPAPKPAPTPTKAGAPPAAADMTAATRVSATTTLPTISYGTPQPRTVADIAAATPVVVPGAGTPNLASRQVMAQVSGQHVSGKILHLRGLDDIEKDVELPDDAKRLLIMHVGKTRADESDHYIVNPELAKEWLKTHDVPDHIKPPEKKKEKKGCSMRHISMKCAQNEAHQAIDKASDEWENLRRQAEQEWGNAADELSDFWKEARACFADKTLSLNEVPVKFSAEPKISIPIGGVSRSGAGGSGEISGTVDLGFPMQTDFAAKLDLFYIPCLPFVIRPKALSAEGSMEMSEVLTASIAATGEVSKTFKVPPTGGGTFPIVMIPIVIAGVPVAELDVGIFIEGSVRVAGEGRAEAQFQVETKQTAQFEFTCNGGGCGKPKKSPLLTSPITTSQSAQLQGTVSVRPAVYTALQLNFNFNALSARAGPEPYLLATAAGCAGVAAEQTQGKGSTSSHNEALTLDLDWGVDFRAEALVGGQIVGNPWTAELVGERHIWFRDLAGGGSTALVAVVDPADAVAAGTAATYKVMMPSCYPYSAPVQYSVTWTGDAVAAPTEGCDWAKGRCRFHPQKPLEIKLTWPSAGSYTLTVRPIGDEHANQVRAFAPEPKPTEVTVTVAGGG